MTPVPILRPYRALVIGMMILWTMLGLVVGLMALAGNRSAVSTNGHVRVGWDGLWAGVSTAVMIGLAATLMAMAGLWLGARLLRWRDAQVAQPSAASTGDPAT